MGAWLDQYYVYWFWLGIPFFVCLFLVLEKHQPVSEPQSEKNLRLLTNLGLFICTMVTFFVIQSFSPLVLAREIYNGWGLFNFVNAPLFIEIVISFLVLDLTMYAQHRLLHKFPLLWRVHKVHQTLIAQRALDFIH